jgi:hypothetical protein
MYLIKYDIKTKIKCFLLEQRSIYAFIIVQVVILGPMVVRSLLQQLLMLREEHRVPIRKIQTREYHCILLKV